MSKSVKFVCFGEILWDVFPDKRHLGGAPLNVALRLASLCDDHSVQIISAVGRDSLGEQALAIIANSQLNSSNIQTNRYPTGTVKVTLSKAGNASYSIANNVAWDHIQATDKACEALSIDSLFVFGSLAARSAVSNKTLEKLISTACFSVFDVNLRSPYFTLDGIFKLMKTSQFIKMNDEELDLICEHFNGPTKEVSAQLKWVKNNSGAAYVCVTLGANGACLLYNDEVTTVPGIPTKVIDTVGAGDSFLATLLWALFRMHFTPHKALSYACAMGSIVAASAGANPVVKTEQLNQLLENN
jgi:fructokinase